MEARCAKLWRRIGTEVAKSETWCNISCKQLNLVVVMVVVIHNFVCL